jgi:hypothetical protein
VVDFTNYDPGSYDYTVNKTGYYESAGTIEVVDEDIFLEVELAPILTYSITFIVTDGPGNPIDGAIVNLDGILQYTNIAGQTIFTGYLPGSYSYVVIKEGYELVTGTAEVIDDDLTIELDLLIDNIGQYEMPGISIYPNPTEGLLNINVSNDFPGTADFILFDLTGKVIAGWNLSNGNNQVDLSGYQKGVYIIQIKTGEDIVKKPVMVK